jgi:HEAT repeat protein
LCGCIVEKTYYDEVLDPRWKGFKASFLDNSGIASISVGPLKEAMEAERDEKVRMELIKSLAGIKHKDAYQALTFFTREKDSEVRRIVVRALAESGDSSVRAGLQNAVNDPRVDQDHGRLSGNRLAGQWQGRQLDPGARRDAAGAAPAA